eukprot:771420-Alexandrium_andersonii.AAC.1
MRPGTASERTCKAVTGLLRTTCLSRMVARMVPSRSRIFLVWCTAMPTGRGWALGAGTWPLRRRPVRKASCPRSSFGRVSAPWRW